jgi:predicted aconitase
MWGRRRKNIKPEKLNLFLEAIEDDEEDIDAIDDVKQQVAALNKAGKSLEEIVDELAGKVGADILGQAIVELKMSEEAPEDVRSAAEDTNEKVQDAEAEAEGEETAKVADEEEGESFNIGESEDDLKQIEEAQFSRKDYNVVVDIIVNAADKIADEIGAEGKAGKIKEILAQDFADVFSADNPRFDVDRFLNAVSDK